MGERPCVLGLLLMGEQMELLTGLWLHLLHVKTRSQSRAWRCCARSSLLATGATNKAGPSQLGSAAPVVFCTAGYQGSLDISS
jgi:hypothetical protein